MLRCTRVVVVDVPSADGELLSRAKDSTSLASRFLRDAVQLAGGDAVVRSQAAREENKNWDETKHQTFIEAQGVPARPSWLSRLDLMVRANEWSRHVTSRHAHSSSERRNKGGEDIVEMHDFMFAADPFGTRGDTRVRRFALGLGHVVP